jgi:hypothetical protein
MTLRRRSPTARRVTIDRLELDLRGLPREIAEGAARGIGSALARALEGKRMPAASAEQINVASVPASATSDAGSLAATIAARIAAAIRSN